MLAMTGVVLLPVVAFVSLRIKHVIATQAHHCDSSTPLRIKHVIANEVKQSICQESKSRVT